MTMLIKTNDTKTTSQISQNNNNKIQSAMEFNCENKFELPHTFCYLLGSFGRGGQRSFNFLDGNVMLGIVYVFNVLV